MTGLKKEYSAPEMRVVEVNAEAVSDGKITMAKLDSTTISPREGNILKGSDTEITPSGTVYVLGVVGTPAVLGFYPLSGNTVPAGKAYYVVN